MATLLTPRRSLEARHVLSLSILAGGGLWLAACLMPAVGWIEAFMLLAPLVLVGLALPLIGPPRAPEAVVRLWHFAGRLVLPSATLLLVAVVCSPSWLAVVLALPWLAVTGMLALVGLLRLLGRRTFPLSAVTHDVGLMYLSIGGTWAVIGRSGWLPLGFPADIIQLTAVHFHYAALLLPVVAGCTLSVLADRPTRWATVGVLIATPLLAVGMTFSPPLSIVTAVALVVATMVIAIAQLRMALRTADATSRTLWLLAGSSLLAAMPLAAVYAAGEFVGVVWIDIPTMLATHGVLNALGFSLPALLAWRRHHLKV